MLSASPYVESIDRANPATTIADGPSVAYTVTFSEAVTGVNSTDFQTALTGTVAVGQIQVAPVSSSVYTVTVSGITGSGTLGLNLVDNNSIHDLAGDPLTQAGYPLAFQNQTVVPVGQSPNGVVAADLTGNGKLDLVVANQNSHNVGVLLGNGDGTFQSEQTYPTDTTPFSVSVADLTGNGIPDIIATSFPEGEIAVLLGNGNGTFQAPTLYSVGAQPFFVAVGNVNGDGIPDLVVANDLSNTVSVLLGNGNGTFQAAENYPAGANPLFVQLADLTGDGKLDIIVTDANVNDIPGDNTVSVLMNNGNGTFQPPQSYAVGAGPAGLQVADLTGNGKLDLAVANAGSNTVSVLMGNGDGTFQPQQTFPAGPSPFYLAAANVNGDGIPNLVTTDSGGGEVSVLLGNGDGTFQAPQSFATEGSPHGVAVADVNGDGRPDLIVANYNSNTVSLLLNAENGDFTGQTYTITPRLTVTTTGDELDSYADSVSDLLNAAAAGDPVSLRDAINAFNNNPAGVAGTIQFDPLLSGGTITLSNGPLELSNTTDTITISGPGAGQLTVSGNNASTVFVVDSGVTADISGLTIADGNGFDGGGINNSGTLTISDSTLSGNSASGDSGGGIYNLGGALTLNNSTLSGNSASLGGGIGVEDGTLTVNNSTLSGNSADYGGGIYDAFGTLTLSNSTLSGNSGYGGGGIYNNNADGGVTLANTLVAGDTADTAADGPERLRPCDGKLLADREHGRHDAERGQRQQSPGGRPAAGPLGQLWRPDRDRAALARQSGHRRRQRQPGGRRQRQSSDHRPARNWISARAQRHRGHRRLRVPGQCDRNDHRRRAGQLHGQPQRPSDRRGGGRPRQPARRDQRLEQRFGRRRGHDPVRSAPVRRDDYARQRPAGAFQHDGHDHHQRPGGRPVDRQRRQRLHRVRRRRRRDGRYFRANHHRRQRFRRRRHRQ